MLDYFLSFLKTDSDAHLLEDAGSSAKENVFVPLPKELFLHIVNMLSVRDLCELSTTCRAYSLLSVNPEIKCVPLIPLAKTFFKRFYNLPDSSYKHVDFFGGIRPRAGSLEAGQSLYQINLLKVSNSDGIDDDQTLATLNDKFLSFRLRRQFETSTSKAFWQHFPKVLSVSFVEMAEPPVISLEEQKALNAGLQELNAVYCQNLEKNKGD